MNPACRLRPVEIGNGAGQLQDTMETARGQLHTLGCIAHQLSRAIVQMNRVFDEICGRLGIGCDTWQTECTIPLTLALVCCLHAGCNFSRAFNRRRQDQIGGGNSRDLDDEIEPVQQRARQLRLVSGDTAIIRHALAGISGIVGVATAARIHGCKWSMRTRRLPWKNAMASSATWKAFWQIQSRWLRIIIFGWKAKSLARFKNVRFKVFQAKDSPGGDLAPSKSAQNFGWSKRLCQLRCAAEALCAGAGFDALQKSGNAYGYCTMKGQISRSLKNWRPLGDLLVKQ